jgi:hypothetical protein
VVGDADQRKTGDIHRLEKIVLAGQVKRFHAIGIVGKGNGMDDAVDPPPLFSPNQVGDFITDPDNIRLVLTSQIKTESERACGRFSPFLRPNHMDNWPLPSKHLPICRHRFLLARPKTKNLFFIPEESSESLQCFATWKNT